MKKSGNKNILYAVWIILCAATAFLGGFGHSMLINYAFLAVMGLLILIVDRHGQRLFQRQKRKERREMKPIFL